MNNNINNTALHVTNFNFYGDDLIALKDNATGEIYTSINSVLRGIGFTDKNQIRKRREKWINDLVISKGIVNFNIPTQEVVSKNGTTLFDDKNTYCISQKKLPLALAKTNITPTMIKNQPELASKLELYQDRCADVLASVFIDKKSTDQIVIQPILDSLNAFTQTVNTTLLSINERLNKLEETYNSANTNVNNKQKSLPKKKFSYWTSKMFPKYNLLKEYFEIDYKNIIYAAIQRIQQYIYPDIELNQIKDDYCYENKLDDCYTMDAIEHNQPIRQLFESMVDNLLEKYGLLSEEIRIKEKTIFDTPQNQID